MPIYMKWGAGPDIPGETSSANYTKFIELGSMQMGIGRSFASALGTTGNRSASAPSISEITVTRTMDSASVLLMQNALVGQPNVPVEIHVALSDGTAVQDFCIYTLTNTALSGYSVSSGGDKPMESLSLNFTKIGFKYCTYDDTGSAAGSPNTGYDLTTNQQSSG